jgi:hypothetical protein
MRIDDPVATMMQWWRRKRRLHACCRPSLAPGSLLGNAEKPTIKEVSGAPGLAQLSKTL